MSAETRKVLELLSEGKISAEDAERLLDKVSGGAPDPAAGSQAAVATAAPASEPAGNKKKPRYLRILVERPGEDNVNIRMPLMFTRTGTRLLAVLPRRVNERLCEHGFDLSALSALNDEEFAKAIEEMNVDIEKGNGKKVKIFCE